MKMFVILLGYNILLQDSVHINISALGGVIYRHKQNRLFSLIPYT